MIIAASFDVSNPENWLNRAIQYGDGLFETMRWHDNKLPLWKFHQSRLNKGLNRLHLQAPNWQLIESTFKSNWPREYQQDGVLKLVVFRKSQGRTYQPKSTELEWFLSVSECEAESMAQPLNLAVAKMSLVKNKALAGIKHLNRLEQVMIASELNKTEGIDDLLVLDEKQRIIETTCQNVVLIKNNELFTPKIVNCGVKGVAISWLKTQFNLNTIHINIKDITQFDGMMVGNSIKGFRSVASVQGLHSFITSAAIQDKITNKWKAIFN